MANEINDEIKRFLSRREGLDPSSEIAPSSDAEVEKISKLVRDIDPRLSVSTQKQEFVNGFVYINVKVLQSGFSHDPIATFILLNKLGTNGSIMPWARISLSEREVIDEIKRGLQLKVERREVRD